MKIVGIIPARYASTRFPGKPLADIHGKPMVQHVYEQACKCSALDKVVVATDHEKIAMAVEGFGGQVVHTSPDHASGTDRCLEALHKLPESYEAVLNIQGDEPFVAPQQLTDLAGLIARPQVDIATLVKKITDYRLLTDPNKVKVVLGAANEALYFSRQAIPFVRDQAVEHWLKHHVYYKHLGLYAYKTSVLEEVSKMGPSSLELAEGLEQLRWLQNGKRIAAAETNLEAMSVDTPEDLAVLLAQ